MKLPKDIIYYPNFIQNHRELYTDLLEEFFSQEPEPLLLGGSRIGIPAFRTDRPNSYSKGTNLERDQMRRHLWLPTTGMLAGQVGTATGVMPSIANFNFYRDGNDFLEFHSDFDNTLGPHVEDVVIAALSFGSERLFQMRRIDGSDEFGIKLEPGSLFVMRGTVQQHWLHALPKMEAGSRLSITFLHHQLDPVQDRSWVLSKVSQKFWDELEQEGPEMVRMYQGEIPTPVYIGTKEEVFTRWCQEPEWKDLVAVAPSLSEYRSPQSLLLKHPDLEALLPEGSKFKTTTTKTGLPEADNVPLTDAPTDFLVAMLARVQEELQNRDNDPR